MEGRAQGGSHPEIPTQPVEYAADEYNRPITLQANDSYTVTLRRPDNSRFAAPESLRVLLDTVGTQRPLIDVVARDEKFYVAGVDDSDPPSQ
jgi:hypothetical protein